MFSKTKTKQSTKNYFNQVKQEISDANAIVIGAGAGLSLAAGFTLSGERFTNYFADFIKKFGITDMYSGGFFSFPSRKAYWSWWSRVIWLSRYQPAPQDTYRRLYELIKGQNYFVLTTNVDHQFQLAGFDKQRLFYTQGDYGLFQQADSQQTFDNFTLIKKMILSQGFQINDNNELLKPDQLSMDVDPKLIAQADQYQLNLRVDSDFVEDDGWHRAAQRFNHFIERYQQQKILFLELGVGNNTPGIIKYPFWQWTYNNPQARLMTVNTTDVAFPQELNHQAIGFKMDINDFIDALKC